MALSDRCLVFSDIVSVCSKLIAFLVIGFAMRGELEMVGTGDPMPTIFISTIFISTIFISTNSDTQTADIYNLASFHSKNLLDSKMSR
jgi:hypothetical protein